jgi:two-component system, response regulator PdtaR
VLILIVEDELLNAMLLEDALRGRHTVAGMARDPEEAIRMAAERRPDLCLCDIKLRRGTSGLDAARELHRRFGVPTLFVSGNCSEAMKRMAAGEGALGCLSKPYSEEDVRAAIDASAALMQGETPRKLPRQLELFR